MKRNIFLLLLLLMLSMLLVSCTPAGELTLTPELTVEPTLTLTPELTVEPTPTIEVLSTQVLERTCSRFGYNINGNGTPNVNYLMSHLNRLNPCVTLVMNNLEMAADIHEMLDNTVIHRDWSRNEGDEWQFVTPDQLVSRWERQGYPELVRYGTNEPSVYDGNIQAFLAYEIDLMQKARAAGFTVAVGNFGIGRYPPNWIDNGIFDDWLRAINQYGHILGVHEYTLGILPFGTGQMPPSALLDRNQVQPASWSTDHPIARVAYPQFLAEAEGETPFGLAQHQLFYPLPSGFTAQAEQTILPTYWHLLRSAWFLIRADELNITRPRIILTESFWDNLDDVWEVRDELKQRYGMNDTRDIRGANSLADLWHYYYPNWSTAEAACHQLVWADNAYPNEYYGFTYFTWSSSLDWASFDASGLRSSWWMALHAMLEEEEC